MPIAIETIGPDQLAAYAGVGVRFRVESLLAVEAIDGGLGGLTLQERAVQPYWKDYDGYGEGGPMRWPERFNVANWGLFLACEDGQAVGGAAVAWGMPDVTLLGGRADAPVLWDIRVAQECRRRGVGTALLAAAAAWAKARGGRSLTIETQNVNVPACRFYARRGCVLERIDRGAYRNCPAVADEVMLLWSLNLGRADNRGKAAPPTAFP